ncbi:MAG: glycosyltransferase family 2 protein, partial [Bacteroidales bacterium]|nr:glycosyltransferase family 2 protein [Bacteroidales bacterium]
MNDRLIITVPCFNEEAALPETCAQLSGLLADMIASGQVADSSRILFVNDGSRDKTWELIARYNAENPYVCGLNLAGNVGHQNALLAGLETAKEIGEIIVSIDADLQDDIHVIPEMVDKYQNGAEIVYGVRKDRKTDTWFKRTTAQLFYKLMSRLGVKSVYNHADFRLMSRRAVQQLCGFKERNLFLRGIVPLLGYCSDFVYYERKERVAGESKYPLRKMAGLAVEGITSFSVMPVHALFWTGVLFILAAIIILIYVLISLLRGVSVSGWASLMLSVWFIGG